MKSIADYSIAEAINRAAFAGLVGLHILVLFGLPALGAPAYVWGLALLPMLWLNIVHWGLIHEAIHKLLFTNPRANEWGGRVLAILMGTSFHVLRFGHLMHHQLNRQFHSEQVQMRTFGAQLNYYFTLLFGVYATEVIMGWMFLALPHAQFMQTVRNRFLREYPQVANSGERFFYTRGNITPTRIDVGLGLVLYGSAFALSGAAWPWLLAFIGVRGVVISFMDNIYHYDTPTDNSKAGKELALPPIVSALLLHGNYHETHHTNPDVPWRALPVTHAMQQRGFDGSLIRHGWMQFGGPSLA